MNKANYGSSRRAAVFLSFVITSRAAPINSLRQGDQSEQRKLVLEKRLP
jgi:hypothetical protein